MDEKIVEMETRKKMEWKKKKSLKMGFLPLEIGSSWKGV